MRRLIAVLAALMVAMVGTATMVGSAAATSQRIRPHQHYIGLVNDTHTNAAIYVVCPGPADGTRTGPPAGNQSVSVERVASGGGYTGSIAREIWAVQQGLLQRGGLHYLQDAPADSDEPAAAV